MWVYMVILCEHFIYNVFAFQLIGQNSWWGARFIISIVEFQAANILKATAFCEIFIMPYAIVLTFMWVD